MGATLKTPPGPPLSFLQVAALSAALGLSSAGLMSGTALAVESAPERVRDLGYGVVLYEYYQGNAFAALTRLDVARARGGIKGHGDNPLLVEGGLMLAYGMTREAKVLFEKVLQSGVSPARRNQAWFYLGKVFYLEKDDSRAVEALVKVDPVLLEEDDPALYHEWLYLRGQLALGNDPALADSMIETLPAESLWRAYLRYNQAVQRMAGAEPDAAIDELGRLASDLTAPPDESEENPGEPAEAQALRERVLLSRGQLQLQQGQYAEARASLQDISLDSPFSDQALFHFAVAAAHAGDFGIALQALNSLQPRPLFTPWLQQVPYARGFVVEQLGDDGRALQAYKEAAEHYQALAQQLAGAREQLSEAQVIQALRFGDPALASGVTLGGADVRRDPYGRLAVQPADFSLAALLATETFQIGLRDLHELYRLQAGLGDWNKQLSSFGFMLDTRQQQRTARIGQTQAALQAQQADQWLAWQADYNARTTQAVERQDLRFFMTDEQKAFDRTIQGVLANLAVLPDDETTAGQRAKIRRIKAYFEWQLADRYAVNRWAAQKQLNGLNTAMESFTAQQAALASGMASDGENKALAARVGDAHERLQAVAGELDQVLAEARDQLLAQVRAELVRQEREVQVYLRAARQAQARLADMLYQAGTVIPVEASGQTSETGAVK